MIGAVTNSPLPPLLIPITKPSPPFSCFSLGLRFCPSTTTVLRTVSPLPSTRAEMDFFRSWSKSWGFGESVTGQKVVAEAVNGFAAGEDVFDAGSAKVSPDHLVIMVNGIIGRILAQRIYRTPNE